MKKLTDSLIGLHTEPKTRPAACEVHGDFESRCFIGNVWSKCPSCEAERIAEEREQAEAKLRRERMVAWQVKIGDAGIPERFHNRTLESFVATTPDQQRALEFSRAYADGFDQVLATGRSAVFIGKPGTGKTHLAVGIGLQVMREKNRTVLFTTVMRAIRRVKDSWSKDSNETETQAIKALVFPDLLILDEVGVQFGTEFERNILFDVLNERYERRRPTILMSNLELEAVRGYLGERVMDRMREDGGKFIAFTWGSYRKGGAQSDHARG